MRSLDQIDAVEDVGIERLTSAHINDDRCADKRVQREPTGRWTCIAEMETLIAVLALADHGNGRLVRDRASDRAAWNHGCSFEV